MMCYRKPTTYEAEILDNIVEQWHEYEPRYVGNTLQLALRLKDEEYSYFATYNLIPHDWLRRLK